MSNSAMMLPVFAQVALTILVALKTLSSRVAALKNREVTLGEIALSAEAWSNNVKKVSNNFNNQFQIPVLFYVVTGFIIMLGKVDLVAIILAWGFVASRCVHSFIHIGKNDVRKRFQAFLVGVVIVTVMFVWLAIRLYLIG